MKRHAAIKFFGVLYLSIAVFWYAIGGEIIQEQFEELKPFVCDYAAMCAISKPTRAFAVRSKSQCTGECRLLRGSCVGVNYVGQSSYCELFSENPTNFSQTVPGCHYIQKIGDKNVLCYEFGFPSATLVTALSGSSQVVGTTFLDGQLFVTRSVDHKVYVYDTTSFQLRRQITLPGVGNLLFGLVPDAINNYLYATDFDRSKVHTVNLTSGVIVSTWNTPNYPTGMSRTRAGNLLVAQGSRTINEYSTGGSLVRSLTDVNVLYQAVEQNPGTWVYSRQQPVNGIAMVSTNGTVLKSFGSSAGAAITQMSGPRGIAIDSNGYVLVADYGNNRILVVDPTLTIARQFSLPVNPALQRPNQVTIDQASRRLYVGEDVSPFRVLVFDYD